ncbi:ATPase domain-containing protein [Geomonas anaerohicana]|uniref:non-specific serine/threonine protein kinase n=1 Tax=Geomonas anaerohicana TaxID=2798583 RepID=A0ABS0YG02_9BACT|nr:ATPase domain-containing protein [Geomonas anaerohicana]MBJ6751235.1 AAA family ATPase [Geomonas anaerohicana]
MEEKTSSEVVSTGVAGFDDILHGGLTAGKMHLLSGAPGTGKTTFSLQFIAEGIRRGEQCLYITVGGAGEELVALAKVGDINLDPAFFAMYAAKITEDILQGPEQRIFHSAETEPAAVLKDLVTEIQRVKPKRLVIDSLSDLRLLTEDYIMYRRLVLSLRQELEGGGSTVLLTYNVTVERTDVDMHLETICHGVIYLEQLVLGFGPTRRRLLVLKIRGRAYRSGWHDFRIVTGGIRVFPTLIAGEHRRPPQQGLISSGNAQLDLLFGGGVNRGSVVAIIGSSGTGKTTVASQYVVAAAKNSEHVAVYLFDETAESYRERADENELAVGELVDKGVIALSHVDIAEFSIGEFSAKLRQEVEERDARILVIDTLSGYANSMPDQGYLAIHLHELLTYLSHMGVTTLLIVEQEGFFGKEPPELKGVSYLADTILLLRFFEHRGEVRRAISVVKKRGYDHEKTIRELSISGKGLSIGEPLVEMQGVLTGVPILAV